MKYYLLLNSEIKGPFPLAMVREMRAAGAIQDETLVAPEGGSNWRPFGTLLKYSPSDDAVIQGGGRCEINRKKKLKVVAGSFIGIVALWAFLAWAEDAFDGPSRRSNSDDESTRVSSSNSRQPKQKANSGAYSLYMQGYNDPKQGEVAELMIPRSSGDEKQGYVIIALGGQDRRNGLPPRFELDRSLD
jgi:hypothetical protein